MARTYYNCKECMGEVAKNYSKSIQMYIFGSTCVNNGFFSVEGTIFHTAENLFLRWSRFWHSSVGKGFTHGHCQGTVTLKYNVPEIHKVADSTILVRLLGFFCPFFIFLHIIHYFCTFFFCLFCVLIFQAQICVCFDSLQLWMFLVKKFITLSFYMFYCISL